MPYAAINGAQIYYQQAGEGPDLVFLHGAGGNHLSWWQQTAGLSQRYRCTSYDARGWGLSRGDLAVGRWALGTDLVALLEHLEIERAHIIAQSMGGRAVAGLVRLAPAKIASLVLCGTTAGATNDRIRELQDVLRDERGESGLREFALADGFEASNRAMAVLYRQINSLNPPRPRGFLGRPPPSYRGSMHEPIAATGVPVLFVVGEFDMITSPEMIRQAHGLVAGSRYHEIQGAGHSAYFERPDEFNEVVGRFVGEVEAARA
jgi:pimeloyl-ACP methyl ester carboxylesterase